MRSRFVQAEVLERYGVSHVHFGIVQYLVIAIALRRCAVVAMRGLVVDTDLFAVMLLS